MNFNGSTINLTANVGLEKVIYADQNRNLEVKFDKIVLCSTCDGKREAVGSTSSKCYSCNGVGIKRDPLFHKE